MSATCLVTPRAIIQRREMPRWLTAIYSVEQVLAAGLLILLAPLLLLVGAVIWVLSRRPPLIAHLRSGQYGRPMWVLKYRTMWGGSDPGFHGFGLIQYITETPAGLKPANDPRVTSRFAHFCRQHSIDELPQLIHIARGEMSMVGPRPITEAEIEEHYGSHAAEVLEARPGLTGLWQTMGRNRLTYRQRLRLDRFLVRNLCLRLYVRVVLRTIPRVLTGRDAW